MAKGDRMEKVDMTKEFNKLSETEKHFIRKLEEMNVDRAKDMRRLRKKNLFTAVTIGLGVLGIYFYSMYAVKQEKFLDDFDEVPDQKENAA